MIGLVQLNQACHFHVRVYTLDACNVELMENHLDMSDAEFETRFENCDLDPAVFSHEAHLRLAWIHINKYGLSQALINIQSQLKSFVKHVGAADKYHSTVTVAAIKMVSHFMERSKSDSFSDLMLEFPQMKSNFKDLIKAHYSFDIFGSEQARIEFMEPDLLPFA